MYVSTNEESFNVVLFRSHLLDERRTRVHAGKELVLRRRFHLEQRAQKQTQPTLHNREHLLGPGGQVSILAFISEIPLANQRGQLFSKML